MFFTRRNLLKTFTALTMLPLAGCGGNSITRHVRFIVMATVDGKPVEGSTVMKFTWTAASESSIHRSEEAEAAILELDGKGTVFMLPGRHNHDGSFNHGGMITQVEYLIDKNISLESTDFPQIENFTGRHPYFRYGPQGYPLMVSFKDEKRFRSVFEVKPEDFPRFFGSGVQFQGVDFEFTDDPITHKILKRLPVLTGPLKEDLTT